MLPPNENTGKKEEIIAGIKSRRRHERERLGRRLNITSSLLPCLMWHILNKGGIRA